jgi:predicted enzyme related to lactoylglutathione lyase
VAHGQITHIEFPADDPERAKRFYNELFGWEFGEIPGFDGYFMFNAGQPEAVGGAIGKRGDSVSDKARMYVETDSIDAVLPRVVGLGGSVVTERTEIPGQGWYAVITDSEGTELGLYEGLPSD